MSIQDIIVDEDLPNFFDAVKISQADEIIEEAKNIKENYDFEIEDSRSVNTLKDAKIPKKAIQGTPWFSILNNPLYADDFNYVGAHVSEREKLINDADDDDDNNCEQSDIVQILLNLSAIPDEIAQQFDFKPGFAHGFRKMMSDYKRGFQR